MSTATQKIGLATATIVAMNAMIGSGIFAMPALLASAVGPAGILTYLFVVASIWCIAQSLARLSSMYPEEGSFYVYTKQWGGHFLGLFALTSYLIGALVAMGLLTQMVGNYLYQAAPNLSPHEWSLAAFALLVALNLFGVAMSDVGQKILIACTVFPILSTILLCFTKANPAHFEPFAPNGLGTVLPATRLVIFSFFGFESAASLFNIVQNPKKNVPKALTYSILMVGALYITFTVAIILAIPLSYFTDASITISQALSVMFPHHTWLIGAIHVAIISATLGTIHSIIWSSSSLFQFIVKKLRGPSNAPSLRVSVLAVSAVIFACFAGLANLDLFFNLTAICIVFAYITAMITLLLNKKEWKSRANIITLFGLVAACIIFTFAMEGTITEIVKFIR